MNLSYGFGVREAVEESEEEGDAHGRRYRGYVARLDGEEESEGYHSDHTSPDVGGREGRERRRYICPGFLDDRRLLRPAYVREGKALLNEVEF